VAAVNVALLVLDGVTPLDFAIPAQIFSPRPETPYELTICGPTPSVRTAIGISMQVQGGLAAVARADIVIVAGFDPPLAPVPPRVVETLRTAHRNGSQLVSICTGAFVLAAAGLLDGKRATTHWQYADALERAHPAVTVQRDVLYLDEGDVLTSAGVCCAIDLCLHIVRRDLGASIANGIARGIVAPPHRDGGQAQFVPAPVPTSGDSALANTREWALRRLAEPLTIPELARHAGMSQRSFMRKFAEETGTTPLQWLLNARVGRVRELLEATDLPIDRIAESCGLGTAANLRLHFRRSLDTTPTAYRRAFAV